MWPDFFDLMGKLGVDFLDFIFQQCIIKLIHFKSNYSNRMKFFNREIKKISNFKQIEIDALQKRDSIAHICI